MLNASSIDRLHAAMLGAALLATAALDTAALTACSPELAAPVPVDASVSAWQGPRQGTFYGAAVRIGDGHARTYKGGSTPVCSSVCHPPW